MKKIVLMAFIFLNFFVLASCRELQEIIDENDITINFETLGGNTVASMTVPKDIDLTTLPTPTRDGYDFEGWYRDENLTLPLTIDMLETEETITIYAKWVPIEGEVIVSFESNGGTIIAPIVLSEGTALSEPVEPTKVGHTFVGWYTDGDFTTAYDFSNLVNESLTLYAKWDINSYQVEFNDQTTVMNVLQVNYNNVVNKPDDPVKTGYTFIDWYQDADFTTLYDFTAAVTDDITIYAKFEPLTFTVNFYDEDTATLLETVTVNYGGTAVAPTPPTKAMTNEKIYTFDGWDKPLENITESIDVYATYKEEIRYYTLMAYDEDLETIYWLKEDIEYGTVLNIFVNAEKEGYQFAGYYTDLLFTNHFDPFAPITSDVTLYASFIPLEPITSISDLIEQAPTEAVRIKGVVYYVTENTKGFYVADETGFIYVDGDTLSEHVGRLLEIEGTYDNSGLFPVFTPTATMLRDTDQPTLDPLESSVLMFEDLEPDASLFGSYLEITGFLLYDESYYLTLFDASLRLSVTDESIKIVLDGLIGEVVTMKVVVADYLPDGLYVAYVVDDQVTLGEISDEVMVDYYLDIIYQSLHESPFVSGSVFFLDVEDLDAVVTFETFGDNSELYDPMTGQFGTVESPQEINVRARVIKNDIDKSIDFTFILNPSDGNDETLSTIEEILLGESQQVYTTEGTIVYKIDTTFILYDGERLILLEDNTDNLVLTDVNINDVIVVSGIKMDTDIIVLVATEVHDVKTTDPLLMGEVPSWHLENIALLDVNDPLNAGLFVEVSGNLIVREDGLILEDDVHTLMIINIDNPSEFMHLNNIPVKLTGFYYYFDLLEVPVFMVFPEWYDIVVNFEDDLAQAEALEDSILSSYLESYQTGDEIVFITDHILSDTALTWMANDDYSAIINQENVILSISEDKIISYTVSFYINDVQFSFIVDLEIKYIEIQDLAWAKTQILAFDDARYQEMTYLDWPLTLGDNNEFTIVYTEYNGYLDIPNLYVKQASFSADFYHAYISVQIYSDMGYEDFEIYVYIDKIAQQSFNDFYLGLDQEEFLIEGELVAKYHGGIILAEVDDEGHKSYLYADIDADDYSVGNVLLLKGKKTSEGGRIRLDSETEIVKLVKYNYPMSLEYDATPYTLASIYALDYESYHTYNDFYLIRGIYHVIDRGFGEEHVIVDGDYIIYLVMPVDSYNDTIPSPYKDGDLITIKVFMYEMFVGDTNEIYMIYRGLNNEVAYGSYTDAEKYQIVEDYLLENFTQLDFVGTERMLFPLNFSPILLIPHVNLHNVEWYVDPNEEPPVDYYFSSGYFSSFYLADVTETTQFTLTAKLKVSYDDPGYLIDFIITVHPLELNPLSHFLLTTDVEMTMKLLIIAEDDTRFLLHDEMGNSIYLNKNLEAFRGEYYYVGDRVIVTGKRTVINNQDYFDDDYSIHYYYIDKSEHSIETNPTITSIEDLMNVQDKSTMIGQFVNITARVELDSQTERYYLTDGTHTVKMLETGKYNDLRYYPWLDLEVEAIIFDYDGDYYVYIVDFTLPNLTNEAMISWIETYVINTYDQYVFRPKEYVLTVYPYPFDEFKIQYDFGPGIGHAQLTVGTIDFSHIEVPIEVVVDVSILLEDVDGSLIIPAYDFTITVYIEPAVPITFDDFYALGPDEDVIIEGIVVLYAHEYLVIKELTTGKLIYLDGTPLYAPESALIIVEGKKEIYYQRHQIKADYEVHLLSEDHNTTIDYTVIDLDDLILLNNLDVLYQGLKVSGRFEVSDNPNYDYQLVSSTEEIIYIRDLSYGSSTLDYSYLQDQMVEMSVLVQYDEQGNLILVYKEYFSLITMK